MPLTQSSIEVQAVCGRQMVQPVGATSHFSGAPLVQRAAPAVHTSLHIGTHTPELQVSPATHWPVITQPLQPEAVSRHSSVTPLAPQRFAPCVQVVAQAWQLPLLQTVFAAHAVGPVHILQPLPSGLQVSMPLPLQRVAPGVQTVPQLPQLPPEQKVEHSVPATHEVQPLAEATQVSGVLPVQRFEPAVQVELHEAHWPVAGLQVLPLGQVRGVHEVQPVLTFHVHSSTPFAVQRVAPLVQAWHELHTPLLQTSP